MANAKLLEPFIRQMEGGWSNHPLDRGGATMCGITFATFCEWRRLKGMPQPTTSDLKTITEQEWADIFKKLYWDRWKADLIGNQSVANLLVDFAWASGPATAIRYIQKHVLWLPADGICGPLTLTCINGFPNQEHLFNLIKAARLQFIDNLIQNHPEQQVFEKGWKRRINLITFQ